jgi:hypothetical protein
LKTLNNQVGSGAVLPKPLPTSTKVKRVSMKNSEVSYESEIVNKNDIKKNLNNVLMNGKLGKKPDNHILIDSKQELEHVWNIIFHYFRKF